jgi:hypothetical protein
LSTIPFQNCYRVSSLTQIYSYIRWIQAYAVGTANVKKGVVPPIWFRGHEQADYILLPSLLRDNIIKTCSPITAASKTTYCTVHTQENQRQSAFRGKLNNISLSGSGPCNNLEWQGLMQHHSINTRMLDWSETLYSALVFALRTILNPNNDETSIIKRRQIEPVLWVLLPSRLNNLVYESLHDENLIDHAIQCLDITITKKKSIKDTIYKNLKNNKTVYFDLSNEYEQKKAQYQILDQSNEKKQKVAMNQLVNLSVIDQHRATFESALPSLLENGEFNPFHYMISRYYSNALPAYGLLPPLATLHPYHSDRIRAQHGAFTVFPINTANISSDTGYSPLNAMEHMADMECCLFEIRIIDAYRVAQELLLSGMRVSNLFPEPEVYSNEFEAVRYYY